MRLFKYLFIVLIITTVSCKEKPAGDIIDPASLNAPINVKLKQLKQSIKSAGTADQKGKIYTEIASLELKKGNISNAVDASRKAVEHLPDSHLSRYNAGSAYVKAGLYKEALEELRLSVKIRGDYSYSHFELGNTLYKMNRYKEAAAEYELAVKLDNNFYKAYNNLGVLYQMMQKKQKAAKAFKRCAAIDPGKAIAYKNLGILYDVVYKNRRLAAVNYKKYLQLYPDCPERKMVERWIKETGN